MQVRKMGFEEVPKESIDAVFKLLDGDRSGSINYEEVDKSLRHLPKERPADDGAAVPASETGGEPSFRSKAGGLAGGEPSFKAKGGSSSRKQVCDLPPSTSVPMCMHLTSSSSRKQASFKKSGTTKLDEAPSPPRETDREATVIAGGAADE